MGKGNVTREYIIEKAAVIFNKNGFAGASMSELMKETGFNQKKINNIVYKLKKQGKIKSERRGVFAKA